MNFLILEKKEGLVVGGCLRVGKRIHIHNGNKAITHCLGALISLAKKNDILFVYSVWELELIKNCLQFEHENFNNIVFKIDGDLTLKVGFKKITIKSITNFLNGYTFSFENVNNDILFLKKTQTQMSILLHELDYILKQYSDRWYLTKGLPSLSPHILSTFLSKNTLYTNNPLTLVLAENYWGGRLFLKKPGVYTNIVYIDFKSMYTKTLLSAFPEGEPIWVPKCTEVRNPGFYSVTVRNTTDVLCLPSKLQGKTVYVPGEVSGVYWYEELLFMLDNGVELVKINEAWLFENMSHYWKPFADLCLKSRSKNQIYNTMYKNIPNVCLGWLGKFGATNDANKRNLMHPVIAASKARIMWYKKYKEIVDLGGDIIYGDTDSFFIQNVQDLKVCLDNFNVQQYSLMVIKGKRCYGLLTLEGELLLRGLQSSEMFYDIKKKYETTGTIY